MPTKPAKPMGCQYPVGEPPTTPCGMLDLAGTAVLGSRRIRVCQAHSTMPDLKEQDLTPIRRP